MLQASYPQRIRSHLQLPGVHGRLGPSHVVQGIQRLCRLRRRMILHGRFRPIPERLYRDLTIISHKAVLFEEFWLAF